MKTFNWSLILLVLGIAMILTDIGLQTFKPSTKPFAVTTGITGTLLVIIGTGLLFSIKSQIKI